LRNVSFLAENDAKTFESFLFQIFQFSDSDEPNRCKWLIWPWPKLKSHDFFPGIVPLYLQIRTGFVRHRVWQRWGLLTAPLISSEFSVLWILFLVTMNCIVSIHYSDSNFELDQCDVHRKKRHTGEPEKELEYKVELLVENSATVTCSFIGLFLAIIIFWFYFRGRI